MSTARERATVLPADVLSCKNQLKQRSHVSHSLAFVATPFVGHRATTRPLGLRLRHLCRTYNNDNPTTSNFYARRPMLARNRAATA